jgi:hypothetical protein
MLGEVQRAKYLEQRVAAAEIEQRFGAAFVYVNLSGGQSIDRDVLAEFRKLTDDTVVWSRSEMAWRVREQFDEPGRRQY